MFSTQASRPESRRQLIINDSLCHCCGACVAVCPPDALFLTKTHLKIDQNACTACERCLRVCPSSALSLIEMIPA